MQKNTKDTLYGAIALFELEQSETGVRIASEHHYRLVAVDELSKDELADYRKRLG